MIPGTQKFGRRQNSSIWSFLAVFVGYSTQVFWLRGRLQRLVPRLHENWDVVKTRRFGLVVSMGNSTQFFFWLRRRFQRTMTLGTRKLGCRQNSSICSFLAVFVGYNTQFLAPETTRRKNTSIWSFLAVIMGNSRRFFGSGYDFNAY